MQVEDFPRIRLEIDHMKHSMMIAVADYQVRFDSDLQAAIDAYFQPENIKRVLAENVKRTIDEAICKELNSYFAYGDGAGVIKDVVSKVCDKVKEQT